MKNEFGENYAMTESSAFGDVPSPEYNQFRKCVKIYPVT